MARQQQDFDELFEIRNYYYIGNYQQCINEAQKLKKPSTPENAIERDIFTYRSYLAQNKFLVVLDEITPSSHERIQPLKLLAEYLHSKEKRTSIVAQLDQKLTGNVNMDNETLLMVAATIYIHEENLESAYKLLHSVDTLEAMALTLDILLKIDRVDLAKKKLKEMQDKDDDATLTQLAQAWTNIATGGDKLKDAYYIYQEMIDKYGATPLLLNGQAVTYIGQAEYQEAESALHQALNNDSNYPDTLVNLIVLANLTGKPSEVAKRYMNQLKGSHADHPFLKDLQHKENEFDKVSLQYYPSNQQVASD